MTIAVLENKKQIRRIRKKYPGIWNEEICHISEEAIDDQCVICRQEYTEENPRILYDCQHSSHLQCVLEFQEKRVLDSPGSCGSPAVQISSKLTCPICDKRINWKRAKLLMRKKNIKLYVNHTVETAKKKLHGGVKKHVHALKKTLSVPDLNRKKKLDQLEASRTPGHSASRDAARGTSSSQRNATRNRSRSTGRGNIPRAGSF